MIEHTDINFTNNSGKNVLADQLEKNDIKCNLLDSTVWQKSKNLFYNLLIQHVAKLKILDHHIDPNLINFILSTSCNIEYFSTCVKELKKSKSTKRGRQLEKIN